MKELLNKELKLAANPLSFLFILFGLLTLVPNYPILVGAFFICFGIFHSFQSARENNDILYTILLPVKKADAVKAKYIFSCFIEMLGFTLSFILTMVRMTVFKDVEVFEQNPLMNANQYYLACMLLIFAAFNFIFIKDFFKTAYKFGKGFLLFIIVSFLIIALAETIHHFPQLTILNTTDGMSTIGLWAMLLVAAAVYVCVTIISMKRAENLFNIVDM